MLLYRVRGIGGGTGRAEPEEGLGLASQEVRPLGQETSYQPETRTEDTMQVSAVARRGGETRESALRHAIQCPTRVRAMYAADGDAMQ